MFVERLLLADPSTGKIIIPTATGCCDLPAQYVTIILRSTITILLYRIDRFNDIVNILEYIPSNERMVRKLNWKVCGTNWLWPKLRFILEFSWGLEETHENNQ
jgi:hypothetical protein